MSYCDRTLTGHRQDTHRRDRTHLGSLQGKQPEALDTDRTLTGRRDRTLTGRDRTFRASCWTAIRF